MQSKAAKIHLKQSCANAPTGVLKRELHSHKGIHHKSVRKVVYAELVARKRGKHAK